MAFQFSLDAVLRLRQSLERQQVSLLREANQQMTALQLRIDNLNTQLSQRATQESAQLACSLSAAELQFIELCRTALMGQRGSLEKRLATAQRVRDACMAGFRLARQRREALETLRQMQVQIYRQQEARQNQRQLDDLLLLRRAYLKRR
jgi:flagellar export protein FliJ